MSKLLVLIPNFNGKKFIAKTITSFSGNKADVEVLVVDDCSTDNPRSYLGNLSISVIYKERNGGFASAVNVGLRYFLEKDYDYLIVANSDILLSDNQFQEISDYLFNEFTKENKQIIGFIESNDIDYQYKDGIDISGFLFAMTRNVVLKTGMFDERFYMYGEEQDYFIRATKAGIKISQSGINVSHLTEGSGGSRYKNSWFAIRNSIFLEFKSKNFLKLLRKISVLFLLINRIYRPKFTEDPSYKRIKRPGILIGNIFLIASIFWNIKNYFLGENHQKHRIK